MKTETWKWTGLQRQTSEFGEIIYLAHDKWSTFKPNETNGFPTGCFKTEAEARNFCESGHPENKQEYILIGDT